MSNVKTTKKIWLKNWAGRWSLCFCSFYEYTHNKGLKKPCIVGTEVATKVLKDGEIVEVRATEGIVKIL